MQLKLINWEIATIIFIISDCCEPVWYKKGNKEIKYLD